ncbi:MAG: hypothetical protein CMQ40_09500 [Gammaproteobacteria bacterium]|nr:hypothetical protein [Gammaproteobacteria bacterium]
MLGESENKKNKTILEDHVAKVKTLEDLLAEQAVRKAVTAYSRGADRCDVEILKSAFHPDAEVKYGSYDGPYEPFCQNVVDGHLTMNYTSHTVINQYYDIDARSGKGAGEIYVLAFLSTSQSGDVMDVKAYKEKKSEGVFDYVVAGRYVDQYECRDEDWRIIHRQYIYDWSRTTDYAGHDPNGLFEGLIYRGKRDKNDLSYRYLKD